MVFSKLSGILAVLSVLHCFTPSNALPEPESLVARSLPFYLHARAENKDGSSPVYKDPTADIEDRVSDLLSRMTVEEKVAQL